MNGGSFRLGTRGSALARRQAKTIERVLTDHRYDVEIVEVSTEGDRIRDDLIHRLGKTGAFVRDLDERVLSGELDAAVHSLKDMPTEMPDDLVVAAVPSRTAPHDVLVTTDGTELAALPADAVVGTGSLRRRAQLLHVRDDLTVQPIRGNVDTRVRKLLGPHLRRTRDELDEDERDEWLAARSDLERSALETDEDAVLDGLVLAEAGLDRLGLLESVATVRLPIDSFVPAAGQGALAVTMRDEESADTVNRLLDDPPTRVAATVERTILAGLGGGCIAPIGVNAVVQGEAVHTRVHVLSLDGSDVVRTTRDLPVESYLEACNELVDDLEEAGAAELIEEAVAKERDRVEE